MSSQPTNDVVEAQLLRLVREYQDMNGTQVVSLDQPPSALEFSQLVAMSRPVVFKSDPTVPDASRWTVDYLTQKLGDQAVSVSVTPDGNADALYTVANAEGVDETFFVEPHSHKLPMKTFIDRLLELDDSADDDGSREVLYLQSQNGNVYSPYDTSSEYAALQVDVPSTLPWVTEALGQEPDAVNVWIGSDRSRTSLHRDPYENIYAVVSGTKTFRVLPPIEGVLLGTRLYPHATWTRSESTGKLTLAPSPPSTPKVPWTSFDPSSPTLPSSSSRTHLAQPLTIAVPQGYSLYLPAGWYHHVTQSPSPPTQDGPRQPCIALNWWFDQTYAGERVVMRTFLEGLARSVGWLEDGWKDDDDDEDVEGDAAVDLGEADEELDDEAEAQRGRDLVESLMAREEDFDELEECD